MKLTNLKKIKMLSAVALSLATLTLNAQPLNRMPVDNMTGYKDTYKGYFSVGVALNTRNVASAEQMAIVKKNFNSVTAENAMKPGEIHPKEGVWNLGEQTASPTGAVRTV